MDSALDSALSPAQTAQPSGWRPSSWRPHLQAALYGLGWQTLASSGRPRRMHIDRLRVLLTTVLASTVGAAAAAAWTWHVNQKTANTGAAVALAAVDMRLDDMAHEMRRVAALPELQSPLVDCPESLVQALLHESLNSALLRRFEAVERNNPVRCGPQGLLMAEPPTVPQHAGLSVMLGNQIAVRPELLFMLGNGRGVKARLDTRALQLQHDLWPESLDAAALVIKAGSAGGGSLSLWGASQTRHGEPPAWLQLQAQVQSAQHGVTLTSAVGMPAFAAQTGRAAAWGALLAGLCVLLVVGWAWRRAVLRSRLVHRLTYALRKRQFEPFVQPIVDLQSGRCVGGEVLMRWNHPQRGILGPGDFIEEAERTGLIVGMSDLTMSLAAHQLAPLAQADPGLYFSFNITPGQLREPGFGQRLAEIFHADTVPRHQVLLELTERDLVDPRAKGMLMALRADGWRIAIDDFGTGQSSLSTIENLPIDRIKIDRAFVSTIDDRTVSRPVLDAIIQLSRELKIPLIAEGIETQSQWDYLATRGVACAQGYLMARPMAVKGYLDWVQQRSSIPAQPVAGADAGATHDHLVPRSAAQLALWQRMAGAQGLRILDRTHKLRTYPRCFVGREAVDWMVAQLSISRREAVRQCRGLLAVGLIHHVLDEHDFEDEAFFYRLALTTASSKQAALPEAVSAKKVFQQATDFPWRSHSRGIVRHLRCATGRTVVDWIVQQHSVPRPTAVQWARLWMQQGALRHVYDEQPLVDSTKFLYRLG